MARPASPLPAQAARRASWLATLTLSVLLAVIGWVAVQWRELLWPRHGDEVVDWQDMGMDWFQRFSYDLPFVVRHSLPDWLRPVAGAHRPIDDVFIVYMDEESTRELHQDPHGPWSRALHAQLLDRLTRDGTRAVLFDVIFDVPTPDDPVLAAAIAKNGMVFLGAAVTVNAQAPLTLDEEQRFHQVGLASERLTQRNPTLYPASRGWGLLTFRPVENDYGVSRLYAGKWREGLDDWPAATWEVAQALGAGLPEDPASRFGRRWINYHGPASLIRSTSYPLALEAPPGFFKGKVVLIGARSQLGSGTKKLLDEFSTPWSRFRGRVFTPGTEIHATILLNLLHHDWLERVPVSAEKWLVALFGLALGLLRWLRPWRILAVALLAAIALAAGACLLQWRARLWGNWAVPVVLQLPLAAVLATGSRYYVEEARKRKLRNAFGFYLSPELADEIAERSFPLAPGGQKVMATLVFTDLEGFTALSEKLGDSARLGQVLTDYFTRTTDQILAEKGTVIKFIGDAVYAAWGAPLPQPDHAVRAVRAAWRLSQVSEMDVAIPQADGSTTVIHVRTRVGIHTGEALAGNLGSARRFDYTLIGDTTNFASRLEGANKYTGTTILLSDDTAQQLGGKFLLRRLGAFKMAGKAKAAVIHELLGEDPSLRPPWLDTFDQALAAWMAGDFTAARAGFATVKAARDGRDGPSQFYLKQLENAVLSPGWNGEVELMEK